MCIDVVRLPTVILVLIALSHVLSPTIEGCAAVRAVKVDREVLVAVIPESDDCLSSLFHAESGTRRHAIVTDKSGRLQPRIDLLSKWLDVDLIVVDGVACGRVGVSVKRCLVFREGQRCLEDLLVFGAKPFAITSQSLWNEENSNAQEE